MKYVSNECSGLPCTLDHLLSIELLLNNFAFFAWISFNVSADERGVILSGHFSRTDCHRDSSDLVETPRRNKPVKFDVV